MPSPAEVSEKEVINSLGVKGNMLQTLVSVFNFQRVRFSGELIVN